MCVIIYSPIGEELPKMSYLDECLLNNPDGTGFMVKTGNRIYFEKGILSNDILVSRIMDVTNYHPDQYDVGIHFRVATHGSVDAGACHPHEIGRKERVLRKKNGYGDRLLMHNGIIHQMPSHTLLSDTQIFIRKNFGRFTSLKTTIKLLKKTSGRFLFFSRDGVYHQGLDYIRDGVLYSNSSFEPYSYFDMSKMDKPKCPCYYNDKWCEICDERDYCMAYYDYENFEDGKYDLSDYDYSEQMLDHWENEKLGTFEY